MNQRAESEQPVTLDQLADDLALVVKALDSLLQGSGRETETDPEWKALVGRTCDRSERPPF